MAFRALQIDNKLAQFALLLRQFNLVLYVGSNIKAHRDHAASAGEAFDNFIPDPVIGADNFGPVISCARASFDDTGRLRQHDGVIAHADASRVFEAENASKGAVPIDQALALIPQCKRTRETFQCGLEAVFSLLGARDGFAHIRHIQHNTH